MPLPFLLFLAVIAAADPGSGAASKLDGTWVCVGGSMTEGEGSTAPGKSYVGRLEALAEKAGRTVVFSNQGKSGWSTGAFAAQGDRAADKVPADAAVVTIMLGTNDARADGPPADVAAASVKSLEKLVAVYRAKAPGARIIIISPPKLFPDRLSERLRKANYNADTPAKLAAIVAGQRALADRLRLVYIDLGDALTAENTVDGVHPTDAGHDRIAVAIWEALNARPTTGPASP